MGKKLMVPCSTCRATGLVKGRPCGDCKGKAYVEAEELSRRK